MMTALRAWVFLVGIGPWLLWALGLDGGVWHAGFTQFCHQRPERSLVMDGTTMVVCSRCAGIYGGVALGIITGLPERLGERAGPFLVASAACMVLEVLSQELGFHGPWHPSRLATGAWFGFALGGWTATLLRDPPSPPLLDA